MSTAADIFDEIERHLASASRIAAALTSHAKTLVEESMPKAVGEVEEYIDDVKRRVERLSAISLGESHATLDEGISKVRDEYERRLQEAMRLASKVRDDSIARISTYLSDSDKRVALAGYYTKLRLEEELSRGREDLDNAIRNTLNHAKDKLEDSKGWLNNLFKGLKDRVKGIFDFIDDLTDPFIKGLALLSNAIIEALRDMLTINVDDIINLQIELQRKLVEKQLEAFKPLETSSKKGGGE